MLEKIKQECLNCKLCAIGGQDVNGNLSNVFSNMNVSQIMIVGQNPGAEEVQKRTPFIGISGKIFDECMEKYAGLKRQDFYICNCVNCWTPENRKPTESEFRNCSYFLAKQIEFLKPKIVVTLGGVALRAVTGLNGITKFHAKVQYSTKYKVNVFPLLHPSPLNTNRPDKKKEFCDGIVKLKEYLKT